MTDTLRQTGTIQGVLGEKLGMTQVFDENNRIVPVTVVKAGPCVVTQVRTPEMDGYSAVQLAFGAIDPRKVNKPEAGHFTKAGVPPRRHLVELRTSDAGDVHRRPGADASRSSPAAPKVDVIGTSKGKGNAGVMKRHNFKGLGAGHGVQRKHRSPGSIGACATPARVFKGTRMAGRMGHERTTTLEPHRPRGRRRARPAAHQGRRPRPDGRPRPRPHRGQERPGEGRRDQVTAPSLETRPLPLHRRGPHRRPGGRPHGRAARRRLRRPGQRRR